MTTTGINQLLAIVVAVTLIALFTAYTVGSDITRVALMLPVLFVAWGSLLTRVQR